MTMRRYNTVLVEITDESDTYTAFDPKVTPSVAGLQIRLVETRYSGVVVEIDTDDAQHAEMIADPDIYEQIGGPVPEYVSGAQAKVALHVAGHLASIEALMDHPDTDPITKIFWENTERFERRSDAINQLAAAIGLTQDDVENLLRQADQIRP